MIEIAKPGVRTLVSSMRFFPCWISFILKRCSGEGYSSNNSNSDFWVFTQAVGQRQTRGTATSYNIYWTSEKGS